MQHSNLHLDFSPLLEVQCLLLPLFLLPTVTVIHAETEKSSYNVPLHFLKMPHVSTNSQMLSNLFS